MIEPDLIKPLCLAFHHIGVACQSIERELETFKTLGYAKEGDFFEDPEQGMRGLIISAKNQPTLELVENLEGQETITTFLKRGVKFYHTCYTTPKIEKAKTAFINRGWMVLSPVKEGVLFRKICFIVNRQGFIVELGEV